MRGRPSLDQAQVLEVRAEHGVRRDGEGRAKARRSVAGSLCGFGHAPSVMLDSRRVSELTFRISEDGTELPLGEGSHAIARDAGGLHVVQGEGGMDALMRVRIDRRGAWLSVAEGAGSVHVNGRRIRRRAMLRAGDAVFLEGAELLLASTRDNVLPDELPGAGAASERGDPRALLRGVGGKHHGRSFTLEQPRLIGSAPEADIRIDDPAFPERHALLSLQDGQIVLRDLGTGDGSHVNGHPLRDAILRPGDQIVFESQHRFVVEAPGTLTLPPDMSLAPAADALPGEIRAPGAGWRRWPWLLLAALLTGGVLAALLMFGAPA